jgi:putative ABC transport system permease protein
MIFSPGSLDGAPVTYVATIRVDPEQEVRLQQAVVAAFPNVSAIHVGDVLRNFANVLDRLAMAIRAVGLFCVVTGGLVMAAALAATRYRRLYESVILKAVGATRGLIARTFAAEYALFGLIGGILAVGLSSVLSWFLLTHIFDLTWRLHPTVLVTGLGCTVLLTLLVGLLSTFRILGQRPLAILRHE